MTEKTANTETQFAETFCPKNVRIVLGITGGIAAYKSAELTRLLVKSAIAVDVVLTDAAQRFITPVTLQALSGRTVYTDLWDARFANNMAHIDLTRDAAAILVAPASANFLAKLAHGLCSDLLTTACIARNATVCPLLVAPAMNREMWNNPATQRNIRQLQEDGVQILGPESGDQACGETGAGRMLEPSELFAVLQQRLGHSRTLAGKHVLVTAGPTFEAIDAVRGITNYSSGKMGYAIAQAALVAGARVTLIGGPTALAPPHGVQTIFIRSAQEMLNAVKAHIATADLFFSVAAVADYTPVDPKPHKMKKSGSSLTLELKPTEDILAYVAALPKPPFCVGFAAESNNVLEYARKKRQSKRLPMIVANMTSAIGADDNAVTIIDAQGDHPVKQALKTTVAQHIVMHAAHLYLNPPSLKRETNA